MAEDASGDGWSEKARPYGGLSGLFCGIVALTVLPGAAWGSEGVAVDIVAPDFAPVGEPFTVDVTLGPVTALDTAQFVVSYDASVLAHVEGGGSLVGAFDYAALARVDSPTVSTARAIVNFPGITGVNGEGPFVRLTFRPLARGSSSIVLTAALLGDGGARAIPTVVGAGVVVDIGVAPSFEKRSHWIFDPPPGGNGDGIANPGEHAYLRLRLRNIGTGAARNVRVLASVYGPAVTIVAGEVAHGAWAADEARTGGAMVHIAPGAAPGEVPVVVDITADNGGPWRYELLLPVVHPPVLFQHRNDWVFDPAPGANHDGVANPGERIRPRLRLMNAGIEPARNARVTLTVSDPAVTVVSGEVRHATWPAGEARNNEGLVLDIAADATPRDVTLVARVEADNGGPWFFSFAISVVVLPVEFSYRNHWTFDPDGNRDGHANPGERVRPRIRLRNDGPGLGRHVRVSLAIHDADVTVVDGEAVHETWPAGEARNNDGLLLDIAPNASPRIVTATVRVTADTGGAWTFAIDIPIAGPAVEFSPRAFWVFDPAPGGDRDGLAEAGERVFLRVRLRNDGHADAAYVRVSLSTDDPDITVVAGDISHAAWAASSARNNEGFMFDVAPDASSHDAALVVNVAAAVGGPWQFTFAAPIRAAPWFSQRNVWAYDPPPGGDRDGRANAGETVLPRIRMRNVGQGDATDVRVSITADDPHVTVVEGLVTHDTWPAGEARNNNGFVVGISAGASGPVTFAVDVTADSGGPWRFTYTLPIVPTVDFERRSVWVWDRVLGNGDGMAHPGEELDVRVRLLNEGSLAGENVVVTLSTSNPGATVSAGTVEHAAWPAGEARNNVGLRVALDLHVAASVDFVVDVTADNGGPWQFDFALPVALPAAAASTDVDGDGAVDIADILAVAAAVGDAATAETAADVNGDGRVDVTDMALVASARAGAAGGAPSTRERAVAAVARWLAEARGSDDGSALYRKGIASLARMLLSLRPRVSALLPNYPNPFNPETWIPFDLAEAADVVITIYGMQGEVVRRIALGRLDAGSYRSRREAAYWDGFNTLGEWAANGVYICELHAGEYREARRMVIRK
ncbi:hypothetical protein CMK11_12275 [Candidatus Poribacteria bacterium]|nr:hypothetical protein [Candidatus Poribacteria bacterium]